MKTPSTFCPLESTGSPTELLLKIAKRKIKQFFTDSDATILERDKANQKPVFHSYLLELNMIIIQGQKLFLEIELMSFLYVYGSVSLTDNL